MISEVGCSPARGAPDHMAHGGDAGQLCANGRQKDRVRLPTDEIHSSPPAPHSQTCMCVFVCVCYLGIQGIQHHFPN